MLLMSPRQQRDVKRLTLLQAICVSGSVNVGGGRWDPSSRICVVDYCNERSDCVLPQTLQSFHVSAAVGVRLKLSITGRRC